MSGDENRDQGAGLSQQLQLQLNQQMLDGVATIVNRQKEEILRSVNEMVSTQWRGGRGGAVAPRSDNFLGALKFVIPM